MATSLDWRRDGLDWPNHDASRFVEAGSVRFHVQVLGDGGPALLLLHGTGASTHSWRALAPLLAGRYRVVMPDLPGHGFSALASSGGMSLPGMARSIAALLKKLDVSPVFVAGHSAGAAILARMAIDGYIAPRALVSLNGAFLPFGGVLRFLSPIARMMASTSLAARFFAARAEDPRATDRLLDGTGSKLDAEGTALYARLVKSPAHVHGALTMMASWDLEPLLRDLGRLHVPTLLVAAGNDRTVPPSQAAQVASRIAGARVERLPGFGHLAHEEAPAQVAALMTAFFDAAPVASV